MDKSIQTLVDDIYTLMTSRDVPEGIDVDAEIDRFGEAMKDLMKKEFKPAAVKDTRRLRLSAIGKDDRQLWYSYNQYEREELKPHTYIKFMYGHMIEELILFLTRLSGHKVEDEQKPAIKRWGIFSKSAKIVCPDMSFPKARVRELFNS